MIILKQNLPSIFFFKGETKHPKYFENQTFEEYEAGNFDSIIFRTKCTFPVLSDRTNLCSPLTIDAIVKGGVITGNIFLPSYMQWHIILHFFFALQGKNHYFQATVSWRFLLRFGPNQGMNKDINPIFSCTIAFCSSSKGQ